jgi:pimeloyl-ACP methyl ester carboxylesterase
LRRIRAVLSRVVVVDRRMEAIKQNVARVEGVATFYRRVPGDGPPTLFVHGNPTHSEDWLPFLERIDGPAIALDLPGWGYSETPSRREFDYSMDGLGRFCESFLDKLGVSEYGLVVHDWGAVALLAAQLHPERLRRLVVINAVPLLPGYRWHWIARFLWRVPIAGELANATTTRTGLRLLARTASPRGEVPAELIDIVWRGRRRGSWPAMLELYRSADPERLAAAGAQLDRLGCPALVAWGAQDPYLPPRWGRAYAERLPNAELLELEGAGHWPWLERPDLVTRVTEFLASSPSVDRSAA